MSIDGKLRPQVQRRTGNGGASADDFVMTDDTRAPVPWLKRISPEGWIRTIIFLVGLGIAGAKFYTSFVTLEFAVARLQTDVTQLQQQVTTLNVQLAANNALLSQLAQERKP